MLLSFTHNIICRTLQAECMGERNMSRSDQNELNVHRHTSLI